MKDSIESMYKELMDLEDSTSRNAFDDLNDLFSSSPSSNYDPTEMETFLTSKEIIKTKEKLEKDFGITVPDESQIEERAHYHRYTKKRIHKYTEKEMEKIKESCKTTIVHDYSEKDFYHMTDEQRAEIDLLSEMGFKLGTLRRTYNKVDQYIEAMRTVVQAWEMLEQKGNFIHSQDEFFEMVADKRIVSNRIIMPKLKRMDKYNIDLIIKYISNEELDPKDLLPIKEETTDEDMFDSFYVDLDKIREDPIIDKYYLEFVASYIDKRKAGEDEEIKGVWEDKSEDERKDEIENIEPNAIEYIQEQLALDKMERLLSEEDAKYIDAHINNPEEFKVKPLKRSWIKNYDQKFVSSKFKGKKKEKRIVEIVHLMLNKIQNNPKFTQDDVTKSFGIMHNMFDTGKKEEDFWDKLYFDGSWASKSNTYVYDLVVAEEMLKLNPPGESYQTYGDKQLKEFFKILESNGVNTVELRRRMNCTNSDLNKEENKRTKKQNAKIEAALIQRLEKLNGDPKFKKLISKAEKELNKYNEE